MKFRKFRWILVDFIVNNVNWADLHLLDHAAVCSRLPGVAAAGIALLRAQTCSPCAFHRGKQATVSA